MKMPHLSYMAVGLVIGVAACLAIQRALVADPESGCDIDSKSEVAPGGAFRATLTTKTCAWGFGLAANFSSVKLEKLATNSWFQTIDFETDQPSSETPTMAWVTPSDLEVVIKSESITGSIQLTEQGLRFIRRYVSSSNGPTTRSSRRANSGAPLS